MCLVFICNQLMKIMRMVKIVCILTHILKHLIFVLYDIQYGSFPKYGSLYPSSAGQWLVVSAHKIFIAAIPNNLAFLVVPLHIVNIISVKKQAFHFTRWNYFLAHLSRRLKWAIVIAHRPSSVRRHPSSVCKLSHFQLLLQNRLIDFDETW